MITEKDKIALLKKFLGELPNDGYVRELVDGKLLVSEDVDFGTTEEQAHIKKVLEENFKSNNLTGYRVAKYPYIIFNEDNIFNPPLAIFKDEEEFPVVVIDVIAGQTDHYHAVTEKDYIYDKFGIIEHWIALVKYKMLDVYSEKDNLANLFGEAETYTSKNIEMDINVGKMFI